MDLRAPTILGRTGLTVSRLGLSSGYGVPAAAAVRAFREHEVNFFHWSTRGGGELVSALRQLVPRQRDRLVIALHHYARPGWYLRWAVERRLRALNIDCADLLLLGAHQRRPGEALLEAARQLQSQGKVRFLGISGHRRALFVELSKDLANPFDVFMVRYNAAHRGAERDVFSALPQSERPGVVSYTATRWGALLKRRGLPSGETPLTATDCYRFVLTSPHVDVCLCGPRNDEQLDLALAALERGPLSQPELARAQRVGDYVYTSHRPRRRPR
ncbi:MAG: aldo/keto reductase [Deltaproteobacteria bacterium]|nr:aldo/keto reductase [Deltaproteobacteria bacterium]